MAERLAQMDTMASKKRVVIRFFMPKEIKLQIHANIRWRLGVFYTTNLSY